MTFHGSRLWVATAWAGTALTALILGGLILAAVWPYNSFTNEPYVLADTGEVTSDGTPVIREGDPVVYSTDFCNEGIDVRMSRWADQYGPYSDAAGVPLYDANDDERAVSYPLDVRDFFSVEPGCNTATASVILAPPLPVNRIYRVRTIVRYQANPLRVLEVSNETPPFLLLASDAEIP